MPNLLRESRAFLRAVPKVVRVYRITDPWVVVSWALGALVPIGFAIGLVWFIWSRRA